MVADEITPVDEATKQIRVGRMLVSFVILLLLIMTAVTFAVSVRVQGATALTSHGVRAAIFIGLCVFLYLGHEWARMTLAFASAYGGVTGIGSIMKVSDDGATQALALVASMALAYLVCALILLFAPPVKAFLRHQLPAKS